MEPLRKKTNKKNQKNNKLKKLKLRVIDPELEKIAEDMLLKPLLRIF